MERLQVIDFISPFYYTYNTVVFRLPDPNRNKWLKLVEPFKIEVHICLAATFCVISVFLYTIEQFNPFYLRSRKVRPTLQGTMLYLFGAMLAQGGPSLSASVSGRSLIACWWIFCLISVATYSGNLIASLTVNEKDLPFDTLKQMVSQDEYKWGTVGGSSYITLLSNSNLSDFKRMWQGIVEFNRTDPQVLSPDSDVHKHKVMTEDYGFIADVPAAHMWMMESCQFTMLKEKFVPQNYAYAVQKGSPYAKYFSEETMKILESGLALILQRNWWPDPGTCQEKSASSKVIELLDIQSAFYVVLIGVVVATVTMLIESCFVKNGPVIKCRLPCFGRISPEN
ncbi:glutamate receptor ionotropic, delta-1 [Patella vulgata]|uniref:glutamate receptor ionotropic, delta-1 n=1 Tax=Patella vulgata TaxID=6465 RepID=UPI00217F9712|nr:glutamate receptor ionotropic, delta-1 [Patella vulgata]